MIVKYGATPTLLTSVQSIGKPVRMLDGWQDLVITVEDFEGALYSTWKDYQGIHIEIKDNSDTYYYFIGTVTDIKNYQDKMVLVCSPVGRLLKKRNFKKNYIYAEGKLKSDPPYAGSNNKIEVETKDDEDFRWGPQEHAFGERNRGILLLDKTDFAKKVWVPTGETTANDDSNDGWAAGDTNAQDATNYTVADSGLTRDASTIFEFSGVKVPNGSFVQKIQIEYRLALSCDAAAFGMEEIQMSIYNYDTPAWEVIRNFTGYSSGGWENIEWFEGNLAQENTIDFSGTAAELAKLLNTNVGYDELKLKFELVNTYSAATDVIIKFDFFQVTIFYETADFSPVMGKITQSGASWLESTDIDFVAKSITEHDGFLIGDNVTKIAQEAFATTGIQAIVDPNFTKYIARYFGGNALAAIMAVQDVEKAHLFDYYIGGAPILKLMLESSFEDVSGGIIGHTDNPITSAHYGHDFVIGSPDNQYKEVIVYGNSYWGVEARAQDRTAANTSKHQLTITDDTIATIADAQEIANALLTFLKVVRKSIVVTLSGAGYETLQPGMNVYATFNDPDIIKTAYPIRRIEKSQGVDGVNGIERTILYLGMGKTPTAERIARFIENANRTLSKIKTYRVTPSGFGGLPSQGDTDTLIAIHAALAAVHHAKYTDTEAAAKIAADDLYLKNDGDISTGDIAIQKSSGDVHLLVKNTHASDDVYITLDSKDDTYLRFYLNGVSKGYLGYNGSSFNIYSVDPFYYDVASGMSHVFRVNFGNKIILDTDRLLAFTNVQVDGAHVFKSADGDNIIQHINFSSAWSNYDKETISANKLYLKLDSIDKNIEGLRGIITIQGAWNPTTEAYPAAPSTGDAWIVTVQHTWDGIDWEQWDWIVWNGYEWIPIHTLSQELQLKVYPGDSIQDMVTLILAAGGGTILLMDGTHDLAGTPITIDDGAGTKTLRIIGQGVNSIIDIGGDSSCFDVDGEQIGHLTLKDFAIDANDLTTNTVRIISIDESNNNPIIIDNVTIYGDGVNGAGIYIDSQNVLVKNCRITDIRIGIIFQIGNASYGNANNNWIQGMTLGGILIDGGSDYCTIKDNHIEDCLTGIDCEGQYFLIEGNRIIDSGATAIYVDEDGHGSIIDNTIYDFVIYGIYINASHITCTSNLIEFSNVNSAVSNAGIYIHADSTYIATTGNVIDNVTNIGAGIGFGISQRTQVTSINTIGNTASNCDQNFDAIMQWNINGSVINWVKSIAGAIWLQQYPLVNDVVFKNKMDTVGNGAYFKFFDSAGAYTNVLAAAFTISSTKVDSTLDDILKIDFDAEDWKAEYPDDVKVIRENEPIGLKVGVMAQLGLKGVQENNIIIEQLKKEIEKLKKIISG